MVRGSLGKLASRALSVAGKWQHQQLRRLNIHEYQGAELMGKYGINVPKGAVVGSVQEVKEVLNKVFPSEKEGYLQTLLLRRNILFFSSNGPRSRGGLMVWAIGPGSALPVLIQLCLKMTPLQIVVKSQILAGGRGLGTFKSGLQGGVHIVKAEEAEGLAAKMLNQILVTKQTGPQGKVVGKVYLCEKMSLVNEMYFAITLDRKTAGPLIIACSKGGTSIEDLAEKYPDMIIKVPIDVFKGITDEDAGKVVDGLAPKTADRQASIEQIKKLYELFCKSDCTMLEINPLAETADKKLVAADAKLNFDDNAAFRQKEIFALRDTTQEDPREVAAAKADLNYIGLDGEIGCMVNGAGLAMATMDIIKLHGGTPANFLDVGGSASEGQVVEAFKILTSDDRVKAILVNIFGGIMKCDVIASGIVNAAKQVDLKVPVVVRLEGTNVDQGKRILKESGMALITAEDLDDAAEKAVKAYIK
ncbi:succinate--CoA ligase [ADP-forming] subunit beta, mitochondrial isoform X2 [Brachypodium distachyon]|uniref:succinate--CoA ligase [ADP-forming] subunit beta, mitochondrial isoform X2 n=1 Tax=Brachypodium distachyon TaxID=15368 RepID=UPI000D0DD30F|nr:succinate--CoA ligase [ADP-forming] subunit beta, mitochondrial isoform X2 [Brachypodium distachyon]|eukprot:XP_024317867.1 succinate--CoA ligase [ADP-forming] subunit beta, mitochondrial isoform X2 [Brachypodium distachyon]